MRLVAELEQPAKTTYFPKHAPGRSSKFSAFEGTVTGYTQTTLLVYDCGDGTALVKKDFERRYNNPLASGSNGAVDLYPGDEDWAKYEPPIQECLTALGLRVRQKFEGWDITVPTGWIPEGHDQATLMRKLELRYPGATIKFGSEPQMLDETGKPGPWHPLISRRNELWRVFVAVLRSA